MMFLDYFGFLVEFLEKGTKSAKSGQISGSYAVAQGSPWSSVGPPQGVACPRRSVAERGLDKPRVRRSVVVLHRGVATVHSMENFMFCFVLFFRCSKALSIGLRRIL